MCQQLSVLRLTPQSSVESGAGDAISISQQHHKQVLLNQGLGLQQQPQTQGFIQQPMAAQTQVEQGVIMMAECCFFIFSKVTFKPQTCLCWLMLLYQELVRPWFLS